jgi:hypothetical protein
VVAHDCQSGIEPKIETQTRTADELPAACDATARPQGSACALG